MVVQIISQGTPKFTFADLKNLDFSSNNNNRDFINDNYEDQLSDTGLRQNYNLGRYSYNIFGSLFKEKNILEKAFVFSKPEKMSVTGANTFMLGFSEPE